MSNNTLNFGKLKIEKLSIYFRINSRCNAYFFTIFQYYLTVPFCILSIYDRLVYSLDDLYEDDNFLPDDNHKQYFFLYKNIKIKMIYE